MLCKACKRDVPNESIFCLHCGVKLVRTREKKKELSVPKPTQAASGEWYAQIMIDGRRHRVKGATPEEYTAKARALKAGLISDSGSDNRKLSQVVRSYIDNNTSTLSPSTIRGYEIIYRNRFKAYMDRPVGKIDFQRMVNDEAKILSAKTVVNSWALISVSLDAAGLEVPKIKKPAVAATDEDWLDFNQIKLFLKEIHGQPVELAALLALHGLRLSELLDLDATQITDKGIAIRGATVFDTNGKLVHKDTNKNKTSRRTVPIMMPRVLELCPKSGKAVTNHPSSIMRGIKSACRRAGLPICSAHDLRRSFASLAFHLGWDAQTTQQLGGWSNLQTVNEVYRKLAEQDKNKDVKKMQAFYLNA